MDGRMSNNTKAYFKQGLIIVMNYSGLNLNVPAGLFATPALQMVVLFWEAPESFGASVSTQTGL